MLKNFIFVALGGSLGAIFRYGLVLLGNALGVSSHLATLIVNVIGSFILGSVISICPPGTMMLFTSIGLCGAFTTFSTYSVQSIELLQTGHYWTAAAYIIGTVIICLVFAWFGLSLGHRIGA